jgi:hypothetical protein
MKAVIGAIALVLASASAYAQPSTGVSAVYHGGLVIKPSHGRLDRHNGNATLKIGPWPFKLSDGSNGIFPAQEAVLIEIGEDPGFYLPAGMLRPRRKGRSFVYRAKRKTAGPRSILSFRLDAKPDGTYIVRFKLRGLDLSRLLVEDPVCSPFAVIIGDDDGFSGAAITSPSFRSPRVAIPSDCDIGDDWPWIRG